MKNHVVSITSGSFEEALEPPKIPGIMLILLGHAHRADLEKIEFFLTFFTISRPNKVFLIMRRDPSVHV